MGVWVCGCTCGDGHGFKVVGQGRDQPQAQTPLRARAYTAATALLLWRCQLTTATPPALSSPLAAQSPTLSTQRADIHGGGAGLGAALVGAAAALQRPLSARPRGRLHLPQSACQTRGASTRSAPEHTPGPVCSRAVDEFLAGVASSFPSLVLDGLRGVHREGCALSAAGPSAAGVWQLTCMCGRQALRRV